MAISTNALVTSAVVIDVDEYAVAMLVGEQEEEWSFPAALVPPGVEVGDELQVSYVNGRPTVLGPESRIDNSLSARLNRPLNQRRITLTAC
jgi:hypothetical protein